MVEDVRVHDDDALPGPDVGVTSASELDREQEAAVAAVDTDERRDDGNSEDADDHSDDGKRYPTLTMHRRRLRHSGLSSRWHIYRRKRNVKSFSRHKAHRAALISVSLALSQTPAYTARPRIRS